jgi:ATP-dependent DNA helicase RecQ
MAAFGTDGRCLMRALQEELDDPDPQDCGRCSVCAGPKFDGPLDEGLVRDGAIHLRSRPVLIEVKKMAPDAEGRMKKIAEPVRAEEGRALARLGDGGWDRLVQSGRAAGRFDDELVAAAAEVIRTWRAPVGWVTAVPSLRSGALVPDFAERLAGALGRPFAPVLARAVDNPPQREMANAPRQVANVRGAFAVSGAVGGEPVLLVDDIRFSGWTLAMLAGQLRAKGAGPVYPFALATAF